MSSFLGAEYRKQAQLDHTAKMLPNYANSKTSIQARIPGLFLAGKLGGFLYAYQCSVYVRISLNPGINSTVILRTIVVLKDSS